MIINCPKCQYPITGVTNPRRTSPNKIYSGGIYCNSCRSNLFIEMEDELVMRVIAWEIDLPVSSKLDDEPREDFKEAIRAHNAECYKSSAVMCRRVLDYMTTAMGATGSLQSKLESLKEKKYIQETTYHRASSVRLFGNYGTHPQDDLLKQVSKDEARYVLMVTKEILEQLGF
jgi:hypothetical protein